MVRGAGAQRAGGRAGGGLSVAAGGAAGGLTQPALGWVLAAHAMCLAAVCRAACGLVRPPHAHLISEVLLYLIFIQTDYHTERYLDRYILYPLIHVT